VLLYGKDPSHGRQLVAEKSTKLPLGDERAEVARAFVADTLEEWGWEAAAEPAVLCTSELVTTLGDVASNPLVLALHRHDDAVRIQIVTTAYDQRFHDLVASGTDQSRSFALVDRTAALWGVHPMASGDAVWFELVRPEPDVAGASQSRQ
jgi:hypothetical protein